PSALGMTTGSPPSITATQLFVVPRSMPMTFATETILPFSLARVPVLLRPNGPSCSSTAAALRGRPLPARRALRPPRLRSRRVRRGRLRRAGERHGPRAQPDPAGLVAPLHDHRDVPRGALRGLHLADGLMPMRVEGLPRLGGQRLDARRLQRAVQLQMHQPDA